VAVACAPNEQRDAEDDDANERVAPAEAELVGEWPTEREHGGADEHPQRRERDRALKAWRRLRRTASRIPENCGDERRRDEQEQRAH
jgi:hypothetical protein